MAPYEQIGKLSAQCAPPPLVAQLIFPLDQKISSSDFSSELLRRQIQFCFICWQRSVRSGLKQIAKGSFFPECTDAFCHILKHMNQIIYLIQQMTSVLQITLPSAVCSLIGPKLFSTNKYVFFSLLKKNQPSDKFTLQIRSLIL